MENCLRLKSIERINPIMTSNDRCVDGIGGCGYVISHSSSTPSHYLMDASTTSTWRTTPIPQMPLNVGWGSNDIKRTYLLDTVTITNDTIFESPTDFMIQGARGELNNLVWVDLKSVSLIWQQDNEEIVIEVNSELPLHSFRISITDTNNPSNTCSINDLVFLGKSKSCFSKEDFEEVINSEFDCGTVAFLSNGAYLTDLGDSTIEFDTFTNYGNMQPQSLSLDITQKYLINVKTKVHSGVGIIRVYHSNGTHTDSMFVPSVYDYQLLLNDIVGVRIEALNDSAFKVVLDRFSIQAVDENNIITENTDIVSIDGEVVSCEV